MQPAQSLKGATMASVAIGILMAIVSVMGLALGLGGLYGDPAGALGPTPSTAGILVPGFLGHDVFNLFVGLPVLVGVVWRARRGSQVALLLWPGALYYVLYTYAIYLIGAAFSSPFLGYAMLVALSGFATIALVAAIEHGLARERLQTAVPARLVGGLLLGLALVTMAQDASGAISTAAAGGAATDPIARAVWSVDLSVEVPAVLVGGLMLWRRRALGYLAGAGLLLQYGLTPVALAFGVLVQAIVTGSAVNWGTVGGVLAFAVVCFAPLGFFIRGAGMRPASPQPTPRHVTASTIRL
jgi:hypothetical protein